MIRQEGMSWFGRPHTLSLFFECQFSLFVVILVLSSTPVFPSLDLDDKHVGLKR